MRDAGRTQLAIELLVLGAEPRVAPADVEPDEGRPAALVGTRVATSVCTFVAGPRASACVPVGSVGWK